MAVKSILHLDLKMILHIPQVQLISNGTVYNHEGLKSATLKHLSHTTFHKIAISSADEAASTTCFYHWHIDAILYELSPPRVIMLYTIHILQGLPQMCHYNDGMGNVLPILLSTTIVILGKMMFDILLCELQSVVVHARVQYTLHPYV